MKLICTKSGVRGKGIGVRRGTAEIELVLVIPVLLVILFLVGGVLAIGTARMRSAYNAENNVYGQVVAGRDFMESTNFEPPAGISAVRPGLPNRYAEADEAAVVAVQGVKDALPVHLEDRAIMLDPSWHISGWPHDDRGTMQPWFAAYVAGAYADEMRWQEVRNSLGLAEVGPP